MAPSGYCSTVDSVGRQTVVTVHCLFLSMGHEPSDNTWPSVGGGGNGVRVAVGVVAPQS